MAPRCWRVTDAAGENRSNTHPVCGNAAPPLNPVATWLLWSSSHFWQLPRWLWEKLWCTGLGKERGTKNRGCSCLLSAGALQRTPQKISREIHHAPSQPLHATALLCRRKHSQPLPNSRHPAFLWICVKKSRWQPGLKGPSGWKFKPQGFLRRTSS